MKHDVYYNTFFRNKFMEVQFSTITRRSIGDHQLLQSCSAMNRL